MSQTLPLTTFASVIGSTRDVIRNAQNRKTEPVHEGEFAPGRRQFNARHGVCYILWEMLMAQGVSAADASECVISQRRNIVRFFDGLKAGKHEPVFVTSLHQAEEDTLTGVRWVLISYMGTGTAEEISDAVAGSLAKVGATLERRPEGSGRTVRTIGGPRLATASVGEAYRLLQIRAQQAEPQAYRVEGEEFLPIDEVEG